MSTPTEKTLTEKNKWYVGKERTKELKYFVKQYNVWRDALTDLNLYSKSLLLGPKVQESHDSSQTERLAASMAFYEDRINMVNEAVASVDPNISKPILFCVIKDIPYEELAANFDIPYGRDLFYEKVRQFIWTLDKLRK